VTVIQEDELEPFPMDGIVVAWIKLTEPEPPEVELKVGEQAYRYARSYPIKGHSAVLPGYLREQLATGKKPLLIERPDRFYVYLAE
jgi:hypothetical protein